MEKYIYKYENKINHKIYIGQTNSIERRKSEHLYGHSYSTSLIERAIKKYGIHNFIFDIIEKTVDYNEREKYWIEYYSSYKPYGYNVCKGGGYLPNQQKESHPQARITEEIAKKIQEDLGNFKLTKPAIVKKYKTTYMIVENINSGHTWNYYNLSYPIRPKESEINKRRALEVIELLKTTTLSYKEIGKRVGWGLSQVSMINSGTNHKQENETYPIRPTPKSYDNKVDQCILLLKEEKTNTEIALLLGTSPTWVSKVNNGKTHRRDDVDYPIRK